MQPLMLPPREAPLAMGGVNGSNREADWRLAVSRERS
jgi:hypothetical protein